MSSEYSHDPNKQVVVSPTGTSVAEVGRRAHPVIARMTQDVLARAEERGLGTSRYRIGDSLLREPDYRQILQWADGLGTSPSEVLKWLADSTEFCIEDAAIRSLAWDLNRRLEWDADRFPGLEVLEYGSDGRALIIELPNLHTLWCKTMVDPLHLSGIPQLIELDCSDNELTELDLSPVTKLNRLNCCNNILTELDLSPVSGLTQLCCGSNQLAQLDLSPVLGLTWLCCEYNPLAALDLSPVPELSELYCASNSLARLDLSPVPGLTKLWCGFNKLTELDLSPVPELTDLRCLYNQLTELDLSPVPGLTMLECDKPVRIMNPPPFLKVRRK